MNKVEQILLAIAIVTLLSMSGKAQVMPDYFFLEVLDSKGQPVENATVEVQNNYYPGEIRKYEIRTDNQGTVRFERAEATFPFSLFSISKEGYFTFNDFGVPRSSGNSKAKIELLKIPQTDEERRQIGQEQLKREFLWAAKTGDSLALRKLLRKGISPNLNTNELRGIPGPKNVSAIVFAAMAGDSETVRILLKAGVSVHATDEPVKSILQKYLAADPLARRKPEDETDEREIVRRFEDGIELLIKAGADINSVNYDSVSPIMTAALKGYTRTVKMLLNQGISANTKDQNGVTVLMRAADSLYGKTASKIETVKLLLKAGSDPNAVRNNGYACPTALMIASFRGDVLAMSALIENGATVNFSCGAQSALAQAVEGGSAKAVKYLLETGADTTVFGADSERILPTAAAKGHTELIKMLIDLGFPVNGKDLGRTALVTAIEQFDPNAKVVNILLEAGADANVIVGSNRFINDCSTPLTIAAGKRRTDIIKALIAKGADVRFICHDGRSALSEAIRARNSTETVKLLIDSGADVKGRQGQLALDDLQSWKNWIRNYDEIRKLFEDAGAKMKPALAIAVEDGQTEIAGQLIDTGADLNIRNAKGETLLMIAAERGYFRIVDLLSQRGAFVDAKSDSGMTALMYAIELPRTFETANVAIIRSLLDAGADVNITAPGYNGETSRKTALMIAAIQGNLEIIQMLLANQADINFDCGNGDSALGAAVRGGNPVAATKLLLESGADAKGRLGQVALEIITNLKITGPNYTYLDVVKLLEAHGAKLQPKN